MLRLRLTALVCIILLVLPVAYLVTEQRGEALVVTSGEHAVVACWIGSRPISLLHCPGHDAIDITAFGESQRGTVAAMDFKKVYLQAPVGGAFIPALTRWYMPPLSVRAFEATLEAEFDLWSGDGQGEESFAMFAPPSNADVTPPPSYAAPAPTPNFDPAKALRRLDEIICTVDGPKCLSAAVWGDFDKDGLTEGVVAAYPTKEPTTDSEPWCIDLFFARFDRDSELLRPNELENTIRRAHCTIAPFLNYAEGLNLSLVPWPSSRWGLALDIDVGLGGGDAYADYYLPLETLEDEPRVAAYYEAAYRYRNDP